MRRLCWCEKSFLRHPIRSCTRATTLRLFRRSGVSGVPFACLERRRCTLARAFSSTRKKRGFSICCPVESVANDFNPTSMPTCSSDAGKAVGSQSHAKVAYHLPVEERLIHTVLGYLQGGDAALPLLGQLSRDAGCPQP